MALDLFFSFNPSTIRRDKVIILKRIGRINHLGNNFLFDRLFHWLLCFLLFILFNWLLLKILVDIITYQFLTDRNTYNRINYSYCTQELLGM